MSNCAEHLWQAVIVRHLKHVFYLKVTEEKDSFVPVFETQVPDCEHDGDQPLEQSELVKIEHDRKCSTHIYMRWSYVLSCSAEIVHLMAP